MHSAMLKRAFHSPVDLLRRICDDAGGPSPSTLMVVAHPDDEVIMVGGQLPRLARAVTVAHVTDGSPRDGVDVAAGGFDGVAAYAAARRRELEAALALAGIMPGQTRALRCPDQEASHRLPDLTQQVLALLGELRPEVLIVHPYEGGHPDHDATAFAVHAACALLRRRRRAAPVLVEATSYHNGPGGIQTGVFLPAAGRDASTMNLTVAQRALKQRMFDCYATQRATLGYFPIATESFRLAPAYDFTRPPHPGTLFYEQFNWGMTGARFRELARTAVRQLDLGDHAEAA